MPRGQVVLGCFVVYFRNSEMMCENCRVRVVGYRNRLRNACMQLLPVAHQQAFVGGVLNKRVFEYIPGTVTRTTAKD